MTSQTTNFNETETSTSSVSDTTENSEITMTEFTEKQKKSVKKIFDEHDSIFVSSSNSEVLFESNDTNKHIQKKLERPQKYSFSTEEIPYFNEKNEDIFQEPVCCCTCCLGCISITIGVLYCMFTFFMIIVACYIKFSIYTIMLLLISVLFITTSVAYFRTVYCPKLEYYQKAGTLGSVVAWGFTALSILILLNQTLKSLKNKNINFQEMTHFGVFAISSFIMFTVAKKHYEVGEYMKVEKEIRGGYNWGK